MDYATGCWSTPDIHHRRGHCLTRRERADTGLAGATGKASGRRRDRPMKFGRIVVHLGAHGGAALGTDVVVLAAGREHQKQLLACRRSAPAARTEEAGRLELFEAV